MEFNWTEENIAVQKSVKSFVDKEVKPVIKEYEQNQEFPREILRKMGEQGFFGTCFPESVGGTELGFVNLAIICEEISKAHPALGYAFNMQAMTCPFTILNWGSDKQIEKYVPDLIAAEKIGMFALTEPGGGSDPAGAMKTVAKADGDQYVINGSKVFITFANEADYGVLFAKTDSSAGHRGISAFIIETDRPGFAAKPIEMSGLGNMMRSCEVFFDNYRIPKENLLGEEGKGFKIAMNALDYGRLTVPARLIGIAQGCLDLSLEYANNRVLKGNPLGKYQMIQQLIADMVVEIEAARMLVYKGAYLKDKGESATRESAHSKYFASVVATRASRAAYEIFGGYALTDEYPVMKYMNYANMLHMGEGAPNVQRVLIAEDALGMKDANRHKIPRRFRLNSDLSD